MDANAAATVELAKAHAATVTAPTAPTRDIEATNNNAMYLRDRLDVHVEKAIAAFKASTSWASFVTSVRGRGDLHPGVKEFALSSCTFAEQIPKIRHSRNDEIGTLVCGENRKCLEKRPSPVLPPRH